MKGFTLIEIVITFAIIAVISVGVVSSFSKLKESQSLENTFNESIALINEARSKTLSSENALQYGVHFEESKTVLFSGAVYDANSPSNITSIISSLIEISSIALNGGGSEIIFQRLTGKTDKFGSITIRVKTNPSKTKTINVKSSGIIDY